ncbi:MAG: prolipoprotein diacylglyceryl transferase [Cytophagales bacterium]
MHPVLFTVGNFTVYTYGFFIAVGAILGGMYMWWQGKKQFGWSFDQANTLFILLVLAGVVGGKLFLILEEPTYYFKNFTKLFSGSGFVFYGSLLTAIPTMLWYFKANRIPILAMLDVMAIVTCIVHGCGRIGCFMAGCCHGIPTNSIFGVVFYDPLCHANPKDVPLHPTQLYESAFIFVLMFALLLVRTKKKFDGQLFMLYLMAYATGRIFIECFRGDSERGFLVQNLITTSQFISILIIVITFFFYVKLNRKTNFNR